MFVFLLSQVPLPVILFLNVRVTLKFLRVRRLSRHAAVEKPVRLVIGWWLNNLSSVFVLIPVISERRIFVQDHRWLFSFGLAAALTIVGLMLMNSALGQELRDLTRTGAPKAPAKPVDTKGQDTL